MGFSKQTITDQFNKTKNKKKAYDPSEGYGISSGTPPWMENSIVGSNGLDAEATDRVALLDRGEGDVLRNYPWSVKTPNQTTLRHTPSILLTEWQSDGMPLWNNIKVLGAELDNSTLYAVDETPYVKLYDGKSTGNIYRLPFFSDYNHMTNSTWGDQTGSVAKVADEFRELAATIKGIGATGIVETRKVWTGASPISYTFEFMLFNTLNVQDIPRNVEFVRALINNNLPIKTNSYAMKPPCMYKISIPGVRYAPVAALDVSVRNIGQVNPMEIYIKANEGYRAERSFSANVPDAYHIVVTVNELLVETRNVYDGANGGTKVRVLGDNAGAFDDGGAGITAT